jgi:hypothetical protein
MWIAKGMFLGLWMFGFGTIIFMHLAVYRGLRPGTAVAINVITSYTTQNPWWWASLVACVVLGYALVRSWPGNSSVALWVALVVTGVVPAVLIGLFVFLAAKLKELGAGR